MYIHILLHMKKMQQPDVVFLLVIQKLKLFPGNMKRITFFEYCFNAFGEFVGNFSFFNYFPFFHIIFLNKTIKKNLNCRMVKF